MAWKLLIGGVDKRTSVTPAPNQARINLHINERATADFVGIPNYLPTRFASVTAYAQDGTTPLFGGTLLKRQVQGMALADKNFATSITCSDGMTYLDWTFLSLDYTASPTVTLKQVLTDVVAGMPGSYGITLDAGQVTGPSIPSFAVTNKQATQIIRDLSTGTGYVATMSPLLALKMFVPGTDAAPFTITDASSHCQSFEWVDPDITPANKVIVQCGPAPPSWAFVDSINFMADGIHSSWTFDVSDNVNTTNIPYTLDGGGGTIHVGGVIKNEAVGEFTWTYDTVDATVTLALVPATPPAVGTVIDFLRNIQPPFTIIRSTGATPVVTQAPYVEANVGSVAEGVALANGYLAQVSQQPRKATVQSLNIGWLPGQLVTVNLTSRSVNASFVITDVDIDLVTDSFWVYTLTMTETTTYQGSVLDRWRELLGSGFGTISSTSVGSGTTTVVSGATSPGGSDTDVQFNDGGSFGGDANFTYKKTTHSVVAGLSSSITAASPESCIVLGKDCHIADP